MPSCLTRAGFRSSRCCSLEVDVDGDIDSPVFGHRMVALNLGTAQFWLPEGSFTRSWESESVEHAIQDDSQSPVWDPERKGKQTMDPDMFPSLTLHCVLSPGCPYSPQFISDALDPWGGWIPHSHISLPSLRDLTTAQRASCGQASASALRCLWWVTAMEMLLQAPTCLCTCTLILFLRYFFWV